MAEGGVSFTNEVEDCQSRKDKTFSTDEVEDKTSTMSTDILSPSVSCDIPEVADTELDRFLDQTRSARMCELKEIQDGCKPVTSQGNRENIDHFFSKRIKAQEQAASHGKENVPLNSDDVEEHRPETVVVEIQGLVEQHRVSNSLGTNFRRHLENIIRGSISQVRRSQTPRPVPTPRQSATPSPVPVPRAQTSPSPPPAAVQTDQSQQVDSRLSPSPSETSSIHEDRNRSNSIASSLSSRTNSNVAEDAEPQVRDPIPQTYERLVAPVDLEELQRENFVQEISELVHRRLVSSTLEGDFRTTLEIRMQERLASTNTDGQRVQQFVQSIQPSQPIIRNDFSHLGIPNQAGADNWDNISVTSVSATAVPYAQSNLHLSREIHSLKSQLMEMKNMMKLSFDLQMDMQRSIRQEVAAAMNMKKYADGNTTLPAAAKSRPVNDTHCLICLDNYSDSVLYQCGHMCVCFTCGRNLMSRGSNCPVCRAPIKDIIRAYRCNED